MAREIGESAMNGITALVEQYHEACDAEDYDAQSEALEMIQNDPLEITVSGTARLGELIEPDAVIILLSTGGPATRIVCDVDPRGELYNPQLQVQDWGTPWIDVPQDSEILREYVSILGICL